MVPRIYSQNNVVRLSALLLFLFASITSFGQNPPSFAIPGSSCPAAAAVTIPMGADTLFFTDANIEALLSTTAIDPDGDPVTYSAVITGTSDNFVTCADIAGGPVMFTVTASDDEMPAMTADCAGGGGGIVVTVLAAGGPPEAICMDITVSLDGSGSVTVVGDDIDNGSNACIGLMPFMVDDGGGAAASKMYTCADTGAIQTLTLVVEDNNAMTATCVANITVVDDTPPTFTCPLDQVVVLEPTAPCTMTIPNLITFASLAPMDNCSSIEADYTITQTPAAASTTSVSDGDPVTVVISVKDKSGNETTCSVTLTGDDTTNPNAVAPATDLNVTLDNTGNYSLDGADSTFLINGNIDNCGTVSANISAVDFDCADIGTNPNMITVTLSDGNGNTAAPYMASVVVSDAVPADTIPNMEVNNATGDCNQTVIIPGSTTDNCTSGTVSNVMATDFKGNPITVTISGSDFDAEFPVGVSTVTYDLTDGTNITSESFTVTVFDDEEPNVLYPSGIILDFANCNDTIVVPNYGFLTTINDNCSGYNLTQTPTPGTLVSSVATLATGETFTVKIVVTDNFPSATNLGDSMTFVVTLDENNTPIPNLPGAILDPISGECGPLVVTAPYAVDACGNTICGVPFPLPAGAIDLGPACGLTGGGCDPFSFDITPTSIPDNDAAGVNIPIVVSESGIVDGASLDLDVTHTWVGDLKASLTSPDGTTIELFDRPGTPPGTFGCAGNDLDVTFTDAGANDFETTCGNAPAIAGPFQPIDPFVGFDTKLSQGTWILNISDNAGGDTGGITGGTLDLCIIQNNSTTTPDYLFPVGTHNITWNYDAGSGNIVSQQQVITVTEDIVGPDLSCQDITVELDGSGNASIVSDDLVQAEGFYMTITEDFGGNANNSGQAMMSITSPGDVTFSFDWDYTNSDPGFEALSYFIDGEPLPFGTVISSSTLAGSTSIPLTTGQVLSIGLLTTDNLFGEFSEVTITGSDFTGDFSLDNWTFSSFGLLDATLDIIDGEVTDNCSDPADILLSLSQTSFDCSNLGTNTVTLTATDEAGNSSQCTSTVTVVDNIAPTLSGVPADLTVDCNSVPAVETGVTADDNCSTVGIIFNEITTQVLDPSLCEFYTYEITRIWTVDDQSGNSVTETQVITVQDIQAPIFSAINFPSTVTANANAGSCNAMVSLEMTDAAVLDLPGCVAFGNLTITNNGNGSGDADASGSYPVGTSTVVFTVTDPCGNSNTYNVDVVVSDNTAPIASCKNNIAVTIPAGQDSIIIDPILVDNGSFDNCPGLVSLSVSPNVFYCNQADGVTEYDITLTVEANGQTSTCETTIIIQDNTDPVAVCVDPVVVYLDQTGNATVTVADVDGGSYDDCSGILSTSISGQTSFTTADVGTYPASDNLITLTAEDINGNTDSCSPEVIVSPPVTCFNVDMDYLAGTGINEVPVNTTNFVNVEGFQFSLKIDTLIASFVGVNNVDPMILGNGPLSVQVLGSGDTISVSWFNTSGTPITLNTAQLFTLSVDVIGAVGETTPVEFIDQPAFADVIVEYGTSIFSSSNGYPPCTMDGSIEVSVFATLPISGNVRTWGITLVDTIITVDNTDPMNPISDTTIIETVVVPVQPVNNVDIAKTEIEAFDTTFTMVAATTNIDGDYTAQVTNIPGGIDELIVDPSKDINWLNNGNVSSSDLFFIQQHIVNNIPFTSIFEFIAADVNGDGEVSTLDIVLAQDVIVNPPGSPSPSIIIDTYSPWRFVPAADSLHLDPLPMLPNAPLVNEEISFANYTSPATDVDWIAVKIGQVFGGLDPTLLTSNDVDTRTGKDFVMTVENQKVVSNELISIPVYSKDYAAFIAWQFTLEFDENTLAYEGMIPGAITGFNEGKLGLNATDEGIIGAAWYGNSIEVNGEDVLFTLQFRALENADALSGLIDVTSRTVTSETSLLNRATGTVSIEFFTPEVTATNSNFELFQNRPNPFKEETLISFNLPEAGYAKVTISDISGRILKLVEGDFAKGYNEVNILSNDLSSTGVLYYQLETAEHTATKKMIILE